MSHKLTTDEFIYRAKQAHNNRYDYSKCNYINAKTNIEIICLIHGSFYQRPDHHLSGFGCSACSNNKQKTLKEFIDQANNIHNYKYDYSKSDYKHNKYKLIIFCKNHGEFKQSPISHLKGQGCPACKFEKLSNIYAFTLKDVIDKCKLIHNNYYEYKIVKYKNTRDYLIIICPKHGEFKQSAIKHLNGQGCSKCSYNVSKIEQIWLNSLNIPENCRQKIIKINNKTFKVDAYVPETNTIYEFYGDYWHGNPKKYSAEKINPHSKKTFGELYQETLEKESVLKKSGYNLITIWENDYTDCK